MSVASVDLTPDTRRYCRYNFGRMSWVEVLAPGPAGDCAGPLLYIVGSDASVCERHWLQLTRDGARVLVTASAPPKPEPAPRDTYDAMRDALEASTPRSHTDGLTRAERRRRERAARKGTPKA